GLHCESLGGAGEDRNAVRLCVLFDSDRRRKYGSLCHAQHGENTRANPYLLSAAPGHPRRNRDDRPGCADLGKQAFSAATKIVRTRRSDHGVPAVGKPVLLLNRRDGRLTRIDAGTSSQMFTCLLDYRPMLPLSRVVWGLVGGALLM